MAKLQRLTGLPNGKVDAANREVRFELSLQGQPPASFVAKYGVIAQVIAGLGRMVLELQNILLAEKGVATGAAEQVARTFVQRDKMSETVIVQLTTPQGVPYSFAIPCKNAAELADQLRSESSHVPIAGRA